ncbi:MAG: hypothetical protein U9N48_03670 [Euryarchaeota archaeon]|nr:hypothetical protein [Euryarchaeota archaeon]
MVYLSRQKLITNAVVRWHKKPESMTFGPVPVGIVVGIVEEKMIAKASSKDEIFAVPKVLNREEARDAR